VNGRRGALVTLLLAGTLAMVPVQRALADAGTVTDFVPGTAVLLDQTTTSSGSGGTVATSTQTNTFSPPVYVDYKRRGSEPVVSVDRYPYPIPTSGDLSKLCPGGVDTTAGACYKDNAYVDSTEGFVYPGYSFFYKSDNRGQTFHLPINDPTTGGRAVAQGRGGGDGFQAVGDLTHSIFFIDLAATNVSMNVSRDGGQTFTDDEFGSGSNAGFVDRQWVATDETSPKGQAVYLNVNNDTNLTASTVAFSRSFQDGAPGSFLINSPCNQASALKDNPGVAPVDDNTPTVCPDPTDPTLQIAGPIVVDKSTIAGPASHPHRIYIPFSRCTPGTGGALINCGPPYQLYVARSDDSGSTWVRRRVATLPPANNPFNIFVEMTVDRGGNLYYTWSQTQGPVTNPDFGGETDVYYAYSTTGGETWSPPINLSSNPGDSEVFPWMVAGDPGQVDLVYYQSNTGLNPNVGFIDANGNPNDAQCGQTIQPVGAVCNPNPSVWNVYFSQSNNALNNSPNFKAVQISDHPNHLGQICTNGLNCSGNRNLGDFFTVDYDHLGAANVVWADDNNSRGRSAIKFGRQLAGNSIFKSTPINLQQTWPITNHSATDPAGDVLNPNGLPSACPTLDILQTSNSRSGDLLTVNLTLGAPPSLPNAIQCALPYVADGAVWGAEFWASADPNGTGSAAGGPDNFYLAEVQDPSGARFEAGRFANSDAQLTGTEPQSREPATASSCVPTPTPSQPNACTLSITASLSGLGIKSGAGLYSVTGLTAYLSGLDTRVPLTRDVAGYSSLADSATAYDDTGTGQTP